MWEKRVHSFNWIKLKWQPTFYFEKTINFTTICLKVPPKLWIMRSIIFLWKCKENFPFLFLFRNQKEKVLKVLFVSKSWNFFIYQVGLDFDILDMWLKKYYGGKCVQVLHLTYFLQSTVYRLPFSTCPESIIDHRFHQKTVVLYCNQKFFPPIQLITTDLPEIERQKIPGSLYHIQ